MLKKIFFSLFVIVCIVDPSNTIFKLKELTFFVFCLLSLSDLYKYFNPVVFMSSLFFAFVFPLLFLLIGFIADYNFSKEIAIDNLKVFIFLFMINFLLNIKIDFVHIFSKLTLLLVPLTFIVLLLFITDNFFLAERFMGDYFNTVMISNREFAGITFLMVYYKTISLLLFGLGLFLTRSKSIFVKILIVIIILTLFFSATRAIFISVLLIFLFHIYRLKFSKTKFKKILFTLLMSLGIILFMPFFINIVFDVNESSNSVKFGFVKDYLALWQDSFFLFITGSGLGSGIYTTERGLTYNLETTYLELFRIFGLFGGIMLILILIFPIIFSIKNKSCLSNQKMYFIMAYFCYVFIVIPSNPLFLSSTGMLVICIAYSLIFRVQKIKNLKL